MRSRVVLVLVAVAGAAWLAQRSCDRPRGIAVGVNQQLAGVWTTTSPNHADRFLEIREREIVFGQGSEGFASYPILGVLLLPEAAERTNYLIRYRLEPGDAAEGRLEVQVGSSDLRIASQPEVSWTRRR